MRYWIFSLAYVLPSSLRDFDIYYIQRTELFYARRLTRRRRLYQNTTSHSDIHGLQKPAYIALKSVYIWHARRIPPRQMLTSAKRI